MTTKRNLASQKIHEIHTDLYEILEETRTSIDELQTEITDEFIHYSEILEEIREEYERCNRLFRQLKRQLYPFQSSLRNQKEYDSE